MAQQADRRTVLVVDDEPTISEVVARYLERAGYAATIAGDGVEALRVATECDPDLVMLDLMLPELDGFEVLRRLQADGEKRTPVILLTAKGEHDDKLAGLRRGADDYIVKLIEATQAAERGDESCPFCKRPVARGHEAALLVFESSPTYSMALSNYPKTRQPGRSHVALS